MRSLFTALAVAGSFLTPIMAQEMPIPRRHIYPDVSAAHADLEAGIRKAARTHKRVLVDFGGDWCGDCQVLDYYFQQPPNESLLEQNFVLVHINVGRIENNLDIGEKYGVPLKKGVPALAILDSHGKLLYAQHGEFEKMRVVDPQEITAFLNTWKPRQR